MSESEKRGPGRPKLPPRSSGSVAEALEITLASLDLRHEAAAHVQAMRHVAEELDRCTYSDRTATLANTFLKQCQELRLWVAPPPIEEDPFDVLARSLAGDK